MALTVEPSPGTAMIVPAVDRFGGWNNPSQEAFASRETHLRRIPGEQMEYSKRNVVTVIVYTLIAKLAGTEALRIG
jgi:hypothetical protein